VWRTILATLAGMLAGVGLAALLLWSTSVVLAWRTAPQIYAIEYSIIYLSIILGACFGALIGAVIATCRHSS
jgi:Na+-driven multidrug efflux pump